MNNIRYFLVVQFLFSLSLCEINNDQKEKFLSGFLKYYNSLPNQVYHSEEGSLQSTQQEVSKTYFLNLEIALKLFKVRCGLSLSETFVSKVILNLNINMNHIFLFITQINLYWNENVIPRQTVYKVIFSCI